MGRRITMADVAQEAGVSLMTVSRVVNNKGDISEATIARVRDVIDRLGYRPSGIARSLATRRTGTLGLVVPDNANPYFSEVARGSEHLAYEQGYNIFLCNTEEQRDRERAVIQSLEEKQVDGLILISSRLEDEDLRNIISRFPAVVLVNRRLDKEGTGGISEVLIDDQLSGRIATQHLLDRGHRNIGMLAGPTTSYTGRQRMRAYIDTMQAAGLEPQPGWIKNCPPKLEGGGQITTEMLSAHPDLTALFCYNDLVAIGAMKACALMGLAVPDDIAIVGHDDIPLAGLVTPTLTTCHISPYEMGNQAVRLLLECIQGHSDGCRTVIVQPELMIRESAP